MPSSRDLLRTSLGEAASAYIHGATLAAPELLDAEVLAVLRRAVQHDAFYVATAVLYGAPLLTADGPLSRAPRVGVIIHNVRA
jgi:predicted nucleic acid-binding protein